MDEKYILKQVMEKGDAMRKAQREYRKAPGDPRKDPIKKACRAEQTRREEDFDRVMADATRALAILKAARNQPANGPPAT